jgi:hypothetical protein
MEALISRYRSAFTGKALHHKVWFKIHLVPHSNCVHRSPTKPEFQEAAFAPRGERQVFVRRAIERFEWKTANPTPPAKRKNATSGHGLSWFAVIVSGASRATRLATGSATPLL